MRTYLLIILGILLNTPLQAKETETFNQEEYNRKVTKEMEEMSQALQAMSKFMIQSMNNMTQAINESIPGITQSMGDLAKSMGPIIKAAQENQNLSKASPSNTVDLPVAAPAPDSIQSSELEDIILEEGETEIKEPNTIYKPKRIRLFPVP